MGFRLSCRTKRQAGDKRIHFFVGSDARTTVHRRPPAFFTQETHNTPSTSRPAAFLNWQHRDSHHRRHRCCCHHQPSWQRHPAARGAIPSYRASAPSRQPLFMNPTPKIPPTPKTPLPQNHQTAAHTISLATHLVLLAVLAAAHPVLLTAIPANLQQKSG